MVGFSHPPGLLLLLLIPLIILFRRAQAVPRRRLLAAFFLLREMQARPPAKSLRFFRLTSSQRLLLLALLIGCLSFAVAGATFRLRRVPPERWLLVVDNTPLSAARFDGVPVLESVRRFLLEVAAGALPGDTITVLTTSPAPAAATFPPGKELAEHLRALAVAPSSASVEESLAATDDLARRYRRAVLFSPRASRWRQRSHAQPASAALQIPADAKTATGNRGIVHSRVRANPEHEGSYDLFLAARTAPESTGPLPVRLTHNGRELPAPPAIAMQRGTGTLFVADLALGPGELEISLPGGDAFTLDDRVSAAIPGGSPVSVALHGGRSEVYEDAVGAGEIFRPAAGGQADVDLFLGDGPGSLARPTLLIAPVRDQPGLQFRQLTAVRGEVGWHPDHPVTAPLRASAFRPSQALAFDFDERFESLAAIDGIPLVLAGEPGGRRKLIWLFDPLENGLFLKPEFVILLRESLLWLAGRGEASTSPAPDELATTEAAAIGQPLLEPKIFAREKTAERRLDLAPYFMLAALLLGLYLAFADTFGPEEEPS